MRSSLMMNLLRILTPEEINELTTTSEGNKRVPLTQIMYRKMGVETEEEIESSSLAKILPFTFPDQEVPAIDEITKEELQEGSEDHILTQEDAASDIDESGANIHEEVLSSGGRLPTSVFILHEKKRFEASVH